MKISIEQLRQDLVDIITPYGYTVEEFISMDRRDLPFGELQDVHLMAAGIFDKA